MRKEIEEQAGLKIETPNDFEELCDYINEKLSKLPYRKERGQLSLSRKTIERLWEREKYNCTPRCSTLNCLAKVAGYKYWSDFKEKMEEFLKEIYCDDITYLNVKWLKPKDYIYFGGYPKNYEISMYLGDSRFRVVISEGYNCRERGFVWTYNPDDY